MKNLKTFSVNLDTSLNYRVCRRIFGYCMLVDLPERAKCRLYWYDDDISRCYISELFVKKKYRNNGIGSKLISFCINKAKEFNFKQIILKCDKNSFMDNYYKKIGFKYYCEDENDDFEWLFNEI